MVQDPLVARLRPAWRAALLRYQADRGAEQGADDLRDLANRFLALLNDKATYAPDVITDAKLRAAMAAAIIAEVEAWERPNP